MHEEKRAEQQESRGDRDKTAQVYTRLRTSLLLQRIAPRTKLDMSQIAKKLDVSVTPVREALIKLEKEGLLKYSPGKGYSTVSLNHKDLLADYELALMIAKYTIAKNVGSFSADGLRSPLTSLDPEAFSESYASFIETLFERLAGLTANHKFIRLMQGFNDRTNYVRRLDLQIPDRRDYIVSNITELIAALRMHEADRAISNLERQAEAKEQMLYELIKEGNARALEAVDEDDIAL